MKSIVQIDHELTNRIRTKGHSMYGFWKLMASQGLYLFVPPIAYFVWLELLSWRAVLVIFTAAYLLSNFLQKIIRHERPNYQELTGYKMWVHSYSFPSSHSAMSASLASTVMLMTAFPSTGLAIATAAIVIPAAFLVGVGRLVVGVHYATDVFFGWLLGFLVAYVSINAVI